MHSVINKCEQVYLWVVTPPSHNRLGANRNHQCFSHLNGQIKPHLAFLTVGAVGRDALRGKRRLPVAGAHAVTLIFLSFTLFLQK